MTDPPLPPGGTRQQITPEEWLAAVGQEISPAKHAGEDWFSTDEYANPRDIENPFTRAEVGREGEYYPGVRGR